MSGGDFNADFGIDFGGGFQLPARMRAIVPVAAYLPSHLTTSAPVAGYTPARPAVSAGYAPHHTVVCRPAASPDDGYWFTTDTPTTNSSALTMGFGSVISYNGYVRFPGVMIPQGSIVRSARVVFTSPDNRSISVCNLLIQAEETDDAEQLEETDFPDNIAKTQGTRWDALPAFVTDETYESPDIAREIQAVIDRPGWEMGNALQLFFTDNNSDLNAFRHVNGIDMGHGEAVLTVEYTPAVKAGHSVSRPSLAGGHTPGRLL